MADCPFPKPCGTLAMKRSRPRQSHAMHLINEPLWQDTWSQNDSPTDDILLSFSVCFPRLCPHQPGRTE